MSTLFRTSLSGSSEHRPTEHQSARALAEPKSRTGSRTMVRTSSSRCTRTAVRSRAALHVQVSYSYFEKDPGQMSNFEFFQVKLCLSSQHTSAHHTKLALRRRWAWATGARSRRQRRPTLWS